MLAFLISAWVLVITLLGYYIVIYDPYLDPFRSMERNTKCLNPNSVDCALVELLKNVPILSKLRGLKARRGSRLEDTVNKARIQ